MMQFFEEKSVRLIFLPYAGASSYAYRDFDQNLPEDIQFTAVDLPGHGKRVNEPLLMDIHEMVEDIFHQVEDQLKQPYALYGHSMGACLGYLLAGLIAQRAPAAQPVHLFFSGKSSPMAQEKMLSKLPEKDFIHALRQYGGIPDELLDHEELLDFFLPVLRADFQAIENYVHQPSIPLDIPITVMLGTEDKVTLGKEIMWGGFTKKELVIKQFQGNHFFIFKHLPDICRVIAESLKPVRMIKGACHL